MNMKWKEYISLDILGSGQFLYVNDVHVEMIVLLIPFCLFVKYHLPELIKAHIQGHKYISYVEKNLTIIYNYTICA